MKPSYTVCNFSSQLSGEVRSQHTIRPTQKMQIEHGVIGPNVYRKKKKKKNWQWFITHKNLSHVNDANVKVRSCEVYIVPVR